MNLRIVFLFLFLNIAIFAQTYTFSEQRYSDALDRTFELNGKISFLKENSLEVEYPQKKRNIVYRDGMLSLSEDGQVIEISENEAQGIMRYFDILLLLHKGDETLLNEQFFIKKSGVNMELSPKGSIKNFLIKITLQGFGKDLKEVTLFMKNLDKVTIKIENEIS
jgi:hypothetical protein